jgi:hypothetical protein
MTATAVCESHEARTRPQEFCVNIEGVEHPWCHHIIMVPQIRDLGGLPADQPVLEINLEDNTERTLGECDVVHIKPGHAYCKKVKYKRG